MGTPYYGSHVASYSHSSIPWFFHIHWLGETAQKYFLEKTFEYSLTSDVSPDPTLPKLSQINGPEIDLSDLSSLEQTLQLLTEAGLI